MKNRKYFQAFSKFPFIGKVIKPSRISIIRPNFFFVTLFLIVLQFLIFDVLLAQSISVKSPNIILQNDFVHFEFEPEYAGLSKMVDKQSGIDHIQPVKSGHSLWSLNFSHGIEQRNLSSTQFRCTNSKIERLADGELRVTFEWNHLEWDLEKLDKKNSKNIPRNFPLGTLSVKVTVELPQNSGIATWRIWVDNNSDMWGLWDVEFPKINGFLASGQYDIARPARPGLLLKACTDTISGVYRGNDMPMQFLCAMKGESAVYMAAHDPEAWNKSFTLEPGGKFFIKTFAENMGVHGSGYKAPFPVMLGVYQGSWMKGCKIYRKFAITAPWLSEGKLLHRSSVPLALKDIGLWFEVGATSTWPVTENWKDNPFLQAHLEAQKQFEVPIGVHWYNWHQIAWDNNYPHFLPAIPGISEQAHFLVSKGMVIMPYINGRIADTFNDDFSYYSSYSTKDQTGETYLEYYGLKKGRMAPMCPYTKFWQDKVSSLVQEIGSQLGVNAVYIDQLAASAPRLCFDKSHGHPLGGGHWWVDGNREMLKKIQIRAHENGRNMIITSETNAEHYISGVDAFLQIPNDGRGIPMLEAVYSGYTLYFGTPATPSDNSDLAWNMYQGRSFIWGCQNGWMGFELLKPEYANKAAFLKKIGKYRIAAKKFLTYGELVDNINSKETITERWNAGKMISTATLPIIQGSVWKAEDNSLGVILVNYLDKKGEIKFEFDPAKYGIKRGSGSYTITQIKPDGMHLISDLPSGTIRRNAILEPLEIQVLEIKVKPGK